MEEIVVIIPIHEFNEDVKTLLHQAIQSVPKNLEVRLSCANGIGEKLSEFKDVKGVKLTIYENDILISVYK